MFIALFPFASISPFPSLPALSPKYFYWPNGQNKWVGGFVYSGGIPLAFKLENGWEE
jgi:hypothetical protein